MLRIGKLTDYAILILGEMAGLPDAILSATSLAELLQLPLPTVSKILKILSEANLVTSIRGAVGGYRLAKPAANITLAHVITAMEGELALTECCEKSGLCGLDSFCKMQVNWQKINKLVLNLLMQWTILDMRNENAEFGYGQ
jgi:FeS assembly SUF system regulator